MRSTRLTQSKRKALAIRAYQETGTVSDACHAAGIARKTWYNWLKADSRFADRVEAAEAHVTQALEDEARKRAIDGKSDTLLIFLLKAHRPDRYVQTHRIEGRIDGEIRHTLSLDEMRTELAGIVGEQVAQALTDPKSLQAALEQVQQLQAPRLIGAGPTAEE